MIYITPTAGLCNRMRALDSALALGRAAGVPVRMVWKLDSDLNCPFEELFDPIPGLEGIENQEISASSAAGQFQGVAIADSRSLARKIKPLVFIVRKARRINKSLRNINKTNRTIGQDRIVHYSTRRDKLVELAIKYDLYLDTFSRFFRGEENFSGFQPTLELKNRIEQLSLWDRNVVGVHIRASDTEPSCSTTHGPISKWLSTIGAIHQSDPSVLFFVASNAILVEERVEREFPSCVIRQAKKSFARDDPAGIKHAAIDLFSLASCKRLLGSKNSSFTETVREIGKIPCELI